MPIPLVETGRDPRQYATLESAGRDELVVGRPETGWRQLSRQQDNDSAGAKACGGITQAYLVSPGATRTERLDFHSVPREDVKVAAARIGLAETTLVGRARRLSRGRPSFISTMPPSSFSKSSCPRAAELWTVTVAGEPVKPTAVPGNQAEARACSSPW